MEKTPANHKRPWTPEDDEIIIESYGYVTMKTLMKRLDRTDEAIKYRARQLLGTTDVFYIGGYVSSVELARIIDVSERTIWEWINYKKLPARKLNATHSDRGSAYSIEPEAFWKWLKKNKQRVNFARVKRGELLPEPKWLEEEIKKATYVKRATTWTEEEKEQAFFLWKNGMHYKDIAERLNRAESGVQKIITEMKKRKGVARKKSYYRADKAAHYKSKLESVGLNDRMLHFYLKEIGQGCLRIDRTVDWDLAHERARALGLSYDEESKLWRKGENK